MKGKDKVSVHRAISKAFPVIASCAIHGGLSIKYEINQLMISGRHGDPLLRLLPTINVN
jgi:hypothetical protein